MYDAEFFEYLEKEQFTDNKGHRRLQQAKTR